ncbi:hypothetical protein EUTSA_v10002790mg [Eutrema salsugineum]|uniref:F-box domain-containing protein n=1 Tax=Eutrema salsugineum TaxID=72664 RepID=V4L0R1_EUTSA|nr:hypothetical protein EUTSA_v10002790mg [Eutrema salsugineum]
MSSRKRQRKTTTTKNPTPGSNPIPSLPNDLILSCLARVPRSYYPYLSLVSKSFRSLLASPELYKTRSLLGRTESCLYLCLQFSADPHPRFFTLCRKPKKKKKKKPSGNLLALIPSPCSRAIPSWSCLFEFGSFIWNIGGSVEDGRLHRPSSLSVLHCHSHTWCEAPSMLTEIRWLPVDLLGKIYVQGDDIDSCTSIEVVDENTQTWDFKPRFNWEEALGLTPSYCWIENVKYCYSHHTREFKWYDIKDEMWKNLKGLLGLPKFARSAQVGLANYDGKLTVFWDKGSRSTGYKKMIWCAEISL